MTAIYCFSGSGHSMAVAGYFSERLHVEVTEICRDVQASADTAIVVFPVYCQNIPPVVVSFLRELKAKSIVIVATYGKISYGNVLWEAARITKADVIAAACVPVGHSFLGEGTQFDSEPLEPIFLRMENPKSVKIPKKIKNPFASFFPAWRSRVGLKLTRGDGCEACDLCGQRCPMGAMEKGTIKGSCIRCLRCVTVCPSSALELKQRTLLKIYFKQKRKGKFVLYL